MTRLDDLSTSNHIHYDWLIVGGGSDARAYEVLKKARKTRITFQKILFFDFEERRNPITLEARNAYQEYKTLHKHIKPLSCSLKNPSGSLKLISKQHFSINSKSRLAVDISCFTRPYYFSLFKYLQDHCGLRSIDVFYTEPSSYVLPKGLIRSYRASEGPLFVMEVPGFPGSTTGKDKTILIVTLGFDGDLSVFISEEVTPDSVVIVNGFPSYSPKFKDISLINNERLLHSANTKQSITYCRASNPYELFNSLIKLRKDNPSAFFNIAPLGPKPMAIGACMFALADKSVRVVYPMPQKYASDTNRRSWQSWRYVVPLGSSLSSESMRAI
jgi:hypothetical protein